jgi:hypothetical protein
MCGKMFRPFALPRVKERRDLSGRWVDSRQVGTLFQIAAPAGECQVVQAGWSAVLPGDNVFDVESAGERSLRQATVFATIAGAAPNRLGPPIHAGCRKV